MFVILVDISFAGIGRDRRTTLTFVPSKFDVVSNVSQWQTMKVWGPQHPLSAVFLLPKWHWSKIGWFLCDQFPLDNVQAFSTFLPRLWSYLALQQNLKLNRRVWRNPPSINQLVTPNRANLQNANDLSKLPCLICDFSLSIVYGS